MKIFFEIPFLAVAGRTYWVCFLWLIFQPAFSCTYPAEKSEAVETPELQSMTNVFAPEPEGYRLNEYRDHVPNSLRGGKVIAFEEAKTFFGQGETVFIDVLYYRHKPPNLPEGTFWSPVKRENIRGSHWLANVGQGVLSDRLETYFKTNLQRLTENDLSRKLVFYCLPKCWLSWNAAKRAISYGYTDVNWFPGGTVEWIEHNMPTENSLPVPFEKK